MFMFLYMRQNMEEKQKYHSDECRQMICIAKIPIYHNILSAI
jgi:hypothetical protein